MDLLTVTKEIAPKGKAYLVVRQGPGGAALEEAPLAEGQKLGPWRLSFRHEMWTMERGLGPDRPRPAGRLVLESLRREQGALWLDQYNRASSVCRTRPPMARRSWRSFWRENRVPAWSGWTARL